MNKEFCEYCRGKICDGKTKTVNEWNKCPWHKADWETNTSLIYWLLDIITLRLTKVLIFKYKIKKYSKQLSK